LNTGSAGRVPKQKAQAPACAGFSGITSYCPSGEAGPAVAGHHCGRTSIVKTRIESCHGSVTCRDRQPTGFEVVILLPA